ncbi:hypothetical protein K8O92_25550 [Nocardia asteroides]|nr:hypothetical protein K8O92_25550 [Nocardia asteroides]
MLPELGRFHRADWLFGGWATVKPSGIEWRKALWGCGFEMVLDGAEECGWVARQLAGRVIGSGWASPCRFLDKILPGCIAVCDRVEHAHPWGYRVCVAWNTASMEDALRVVIVAGGAAHFKTINSVCEKSGYSVVSCLFARSVKSGSPILPSSAAVIGELLEVIPGGMDLVLPGSAAGLADALPGYRPDVIVACGFPWKFPAAVLRIPELGVLNIHPSLLPKHRGPMPIAWAIRNGDTGFGLTVHRMDEEFDTGEILSSRGGIPLDEDPTPERLWGRMDPVIHDLLPDALNKVVAGIPGLPQDAGEASYESSFEPGFYRVDWSNTAVVVHNQVRALRSLGTGPVAQIGDRRIRVLRTRLDPGEGERVECADGPLWIVESTSV